MQDTTIIMTKRGGVAVSGGEASPKVVCRYRMLQNISLLGI
jgi:hypothetical protein